MSFYGRYFRFVKRLGRIFKHKYRPEAGVSWEGPAVYLCKHQNMHGPITTMIWLSAPVHTWVFHVFTEKATCYQQFLGYTFSERLKWQPWRVRFTSWLGASLIPPLMQSMRSIPVYRKSMESMKTVRQSVKALAAGESLMIYPDIEYTNETDHIGEMYEGFLLMERSYRHLKGEHIRFVPLYVDDKACLIRQGEPVQFSDDAPFDEDLKRVSREIRERINAMAENEPERGVTAN